MLAAPRVVLATCEVTEGGLERLSPAEQNQVARGRTPKRRAEFIAGRVAARRAYESLTGVRYQGSILGRDAGVDAGRPIFCSDERVALSISHSDGLAVAAVSPASRVGVDLDAFQRVSSSFAGEAFGPVELEGLSALVQHLPVELAAWTVKEAALKVWGVGLRAPLGRVTVEAADVRHGTMSAEFTARLHSDVEALGPVPRAMDGWVGAFRDRWVLAICVERNG